MTNPDRSATFYDSIASSYDEHLMASPGDKWARDAFRQLVVENVALPGPILDFGCGTGTDALWYAAHGYTVFAFDNSTGMMAQLRRKCELEIRAGAILPYHGDYESFLQAFGGMPRPKAVVANFAVLNLIPDLGPLFETLGVNLHLGANVIISLLSPFYWREMVHKSWWVNQARSIRRPFVHVRGVETDTFRHRLRAVRASASPWFTEVGTAGVGAIIRYGRGSHNWHDPRSVGERLEVRLWRRVPVRAIGQYAFIVLRKTQ